MPYTGRFAPSPTGPLHFGSLAAALASYLDARHYGGVWLLRIEDMDPPRESVSAPAEIMEQLRALSLHWDGDVLFQSTRSDAYASALNSLSAKRRVFPCTCTRKATPAVYPGTCRHREFETTSDTYAVRFRLGDQRLTFSDRVFGLQSWLPDTDIGDVIVKRKDGLFAYQLAVVVDDDYQGVNQVVRGSDLLDSTPWQLALADALDIQRPAYLHIPVLTDASGSKLSKQSHARPLDTSDSLSLLRAGLRALGQPDCAEAASNEELLEEASRAWQIERIPRHIEIKAPSIYL